jgi:hypothetical protein
LEHQTIETGCACLSLESNAGKDRIFAREIIPHLNDYAEGGLLGTFQETHPWVSAFINPNSTFDDAMLELVRDANATTLIIADFVKHMAATIITVAWQEKMRSFVERCQWVFSYISLSPWQMP